MENQDLQDFQGIEETRQDATKNKNAVQKFAQDARVALNEGVRRQAFYYGVTAENWQNVDPDAATVEGRVLSDVERRSRKELIARARQNKSFDKTMEEAAYGWFNRLIALRYMEVNNYLPSRVRVFTDANGAFRPEILDAALEIDLPGLDRERVVEALENNETAALYRYLLLLQCNALNAELPRLFEPTGGYSESLLPTNVLSPDGVIAQMVAQISDKYWLENGVQVVGWLYQYYNADAKAETYALLKKNVKITQERVPFATQLFTPDWIVRYMVENSLGRLAISARLREEGPFATEAARIERERALAEEYGWRYYLPEAEQTPEVRARLDASAAEFDLENAKIIDPCAGSGHILVYAFDVLMQIYKRRGFADRDAARNIVEKNLYGLDIDERAAQLAYFAVAMKARQYDRRFLTRGIEPQVYSPKGWEDGEKYGSLLAANDALGLNSEGATPELFVAETQSERNCRNYLRLLAQKYDVVVTNPPYLATSNVFADLANFAKKSYPDGKSDLFACFIERCGEMTSAGGYYAMVTMHSWMFLSSYEKLRAKLLRDDVVNMAHLGARAFEEIGGEVVQTTAFAMRKHSAPGYRGTYCRLIEPTTQDGKEAAFLAGEGRYEADQANFAKIPGAPIAYWVSERTFQAFSLEKSLNDYAYPKQGLATTDNNRFLRLWYEIIFERIGFNCNRENAIANNVKWFPYNKGGEFRKWYGNNDYIVDYENDGAEIKKSVLRKYPYLKTPEFVVKNQQFYYQRGVTWSSLSSGPASFRYSKEGFLFDTKGPICFVKAETSEEYLLGVLNSAVVKNFLKILTPTLDYNPGPIGKLPFIIRAKAVTQVEGLVTECVALSKADWDAFETSWDFARHPLVGRSVATVAEAFAAWEAECDERFRRLKANEEELNRIFIDIYGLADELTPEVDDKDVTVRRADLVRDIKSLISYAVGCMFGRYSLVVDGLAYAGGDWDASKYGDKDKNFQPDEDAIIPICDDDYFKDDATTRFAEWLKFAFGAETLDENLRFIAVALGGDGKAPKETIRAYFLNGFFKDHVQTYQKRPIYWLFDSGKKNGFKALHYVHRYRPDTIARLRVKYVHELQGRYRAQLERLDAALDAADLKSSERVNLTKRRKKLDDQAHELRKYEEKVRVRADEKRVLDLDDGVKHNYALFADILASIK